MRRTLDTNICSYILRRRPQGDVERRLVCWRGRAIELEEHQSGQRHAGEDHDLD